MSHRTRYVAVPCPGCLSRAAWIPAQAKEIDVIDWPRREATETGAVFYNHADPKRATFKRVDTDSLDSRVFFKRDPKHVNMVRKGFQCNGCADLEEGAW